MNTTTAEIKQLQFWGDIPNKTIVVLISGKAGAGKSTVAQYLKKELGSTHDVLLDSFADDIKKCAFGYFDWDGIKDDRGRKLLQDLGRVGRMYNENVWVDPVIQTCLDYPFPPDFLIIDDWRFPNELERFKSYNEFIVITVRIVRKDIETFLGALANDVSEMSLTDDDKFDFYIYNDGSLLDLSLKTKDLINYIFSI